MGRPVRAICLSLVMTLGAAKAFAATADAMTLELNDSQRVGLYGSAASVVVGNPLVADVAMLDSHSLVISGKGFGATRVEVYDSNGRELFNRRVVIVAPQANQVTLYRGPDANEFNCSPKCHVVAANSSGGGSAPSGGSAPASAPTTTTMTISQTSVPQH
ncbi:pilus assembly protein N-terminal domain-containing protein [Phenylobacterium montanum]|uniref:Pilus assembly protein N-terminal domain-containing protein n=1 Tax=Phenylobacterium montanum TaxID=2823693 RepID=A0A975FWW4_9CAUL|nr:pilus assembly protein N-terminal domain-containing protein [Caulobacter sp. S6]QUD86749.1 pilus assembly protein N-terminal domain-containing protein [Caulobacter sp. S6]